VGFIRPDSKNDTGEWKISRGNKGKSRSCTKCHRKTATLRKGKKKEKEGERLTSNDHRQKEDWVKPSKGTVTITRWQEGGRREKETPFVTLRAKRGKRHRRHKS